MHSARRFAVAALVLILLSSCSRVSAVTAETARYTFSYEFESGSRLEGSFDGQSYTGANAAFQGSLIVLPSPALAKYTEPSGFSFVWNMVLPTHTTSQVSLISPGEFAFVSVDGSKMDLAFAAGDRLLFLENGIQNQGTLNGASTTNLLPVDLSEPFDPSNWSLARVPEPSSIGLLSVCTALMALRRQPRV